MRVALVGDTMLGRAVAERVAESPSPRLLGDAVVELLRDADLTVANLECCISDRRQRWPDPRKPFFFRAPPAAAALLADWGVDVVTVANNHALDYGVEALLDTLEHLDRAGIATVGAGAGVADARRPLHTVVDGTPVRVVGVTDHPADFAAGERRPGVAYADLRAGVPPWLTEACAGDGEEVVLVTPHWGPNMTTEPLPYVQRAADRLLDAGATVIAGHSAHVFHGVRFAGRRAVLYDLGDFLDDYAVDPQLRNDLGLLWLLDVSRDGVERLEALPLQLDFCATDVARGDAARWITRRLQRACAPFGTAVDEDGGRLLLHPA